MMALSEQMKMVTAAGERLQVRLLRPDGCEPEENRPTLVFLHEALGSITQWRDFPDALVESTGLPALVYDRCGFGGSQVLDVPRGLNYLEREVEVMHDLLEVCCVRKPLLVGHSDGASLALLYAATFPERPLAVISEAAHLFVEDETLAGIRNTVELWQTTDLRDRLLRYQGEHTDRAFAAWTVTWLDPAFRGWTIEAHMKKVFCPVLALQGEADEFGTVKQLDAIGASVAGPCRCRLLPVCGHTPHREARAEVLEAMTDFVEELLQTA